ncbi:MAG: guanylate cyclase, partial [Okeania sp. SIO2D1]|nr:guanylate cyclase [Okeania sp. SIO2D1]
MSKMFTKAARRVNLRTVLIVPFIVQIVGAVGLVGYLSFRNGQKAVNELASQLMDEVGDRLEQHFDSYLAVPHLVNQVNADNIQSGLLDVNNFPQTGKYFWRQLQTFETVSFVQFASKEGEFIGAEKFNSRQFAIEIKDKSTGSDKYAYAVDKEGNATEQVIGSKQDYDPRVRPWYKSAKSAQQPTWSEIYQFSTDSAVRLGITAVAPFYDEDGDFQGVLGTDIVLSQLADDLRSIKIGKSGETFIIERDGILVA